MKQPNSGRSISNLSWILKFSRVAFQDGGGGQLGRLNGSEKDREGKVGGFPAVGEGRSGFNNSTAGARWDGFKFARTSERRVSRS